MNHQFDELTKSLAQSVTRRAALKKFSLGLAGMALAGFGLANKAEANNKKCLPSGTWDARATGSVAAKSALVAIWASQNTALHRSLRVCAKNLFVLVGRRGLA